MNIKKKVKKTTLKAKFVEAKIISMKFHTSQDYEIPWKERNYFANDCELRS